MASNPAARDTALLTPDATPAWCASTDPMTAVVSGATVVPIPSPRTTMPGKNVVQYGPPVAGRANRANPPPATSGPSTRGRRVPNRATTAPANGLIVATRTTRGRSEAPAEAAEYPCTWMRSNGTKKKAPPSAA